MAPEDAHLLVPITLCGKRDFAGVIPLRILRWGNHLGSDVITRVFVRGRQEAGSKDGGMLAASGRSWTSQGNRFAPRTSKRNATLLTADPLILAPLRLLLDF